MKIRALCQLADSMPKKALITTNHMASFSGSEIVALEFAEAFAERGIEVEIYANYIGSPMAEEAARCNIRLSSDETYPNPFDFDIVYSQHHVMPLLLADKVKNGLKKPYFIYAHLSPYEPFEVPGVFSERILADQIYVNSSEVKESLIRYGIDSINVTIFHNAAPNKFFEIQQKTLPDLKHIIIVSNHVVQELYNVIPLLTNKGIRVSIFGHGGRKERITDVHIENADAVITIGKTTQYAFAGSRPVYCYDHFGGPGWLTLENYERSAEKNYSGRCCMRKISSEQILEELITGFSKAHHDIKYIKEASMIRYNLETYVEQILANASSKTGRIVDFVDAEFSYLLNTEKKLSELIRREHRNVQVLSSEYSSKYSSTYKTMQQYRLALFIVLSILMIMFIFSLKQ